VGLQLEALNCKTTKNLRDRNRYHKKNNKFEIPFCVIHVLERDLRRLHDKNTASDAVAYSSGYIGRNI
jgi:hypothetical protein